MSIVIPEEAAKIETGWVNPPQLSDLQQNYNDAQIEQKAQLTRIQTWRDNLNIAGSAKLKKIKGKSNVQPKVIRKQAEWRYPALTEPFLSTEDIFNVYPRTYRDTLRAQQNQVVLNYQFNNQINKVHFIDRFVRAAVNDGTVIVRVGWFNDTRTTKQMQPQYMLIPVVNGNTAAENLYRRYMTLLQLSKTDPETFKNNADAGTQQAIQHLLQTGQITVPRQVGEEEVEVDEIIENRPTVQVCDPDNVIIDPSCEGDLDKAGFIIYSFETSKSELNKSGVEYHNLKVIGQETSPSPLTTPDYSPGADVSTFEFKDDTRAKFVATEYWGYWDYDNSGITKPIVATWVGSVLIRLEASPFPDGKLPFVIAQLMPVERSSYGEPDGELLIDNQKIIGAITRGMIDLLGKSAAGQTGYRKDFLDVTNARKFREGLDYAFNGSVDPRLGVYQHTYPEIPASAFNMLNLQNADAESLSGVKTYNTGINSSALGDVAAGIKGVLDSTSKRETSILRRLAEGIVAIGKKFISMNAEFLSEEEVIRLTDEEFVTVKRDDLGGQHDIKLAISTAEEDNAKAQELAFMLQTGAASSDPGEVRMIRAEIARLRNMPELAKRIESYQPQPDPIAVQTAQTNLLLLRAQLQNELAQAKERSADADLTAIQAIAEQADAILTYAKVDTEKAKTRNLNSDSDNKDLNYLEQESGVTQEREMQRIEGQANSQARTKVVEAILDHGKNQQAGK